MKKKNGKKKFNNFKKNIKDFIKDEKGFITKENILKIGLGTISALGILSSLTNSFAGHTSHANHSNALSRDPIPQTECYRIQHSSHAHHASHVSY
ncbi:MAG: hypothetical protein ABSB18_00670 [Candidatus Omnitrophota bacterium]